MYGRGYERGPSGFSGGLPPITPMVRNIIIANGLIWLLCVASRNFDPSSLMLNTFDFRPWQPFTYMWLHDTGQLLHILGNMLGLYFFGGDLERIWGPRQFLRFYVVCGVGAGFLIWIWDFIFGPHVTLGASGAVYGILTAFSLTWPDRTIQMIFPPIPFRAIYLVPLLFVLQLSMGGAVSHIGHLGGVIVALVALRRSFAPHFSMRTLRYRWNRYRMRNRLRAVRREEWERRNVRDDDDDQPTIH